VINVKHPPVKCGQCGGNGICQRCSGSGQVEADSVPPDKRAEPTLEEWIGGMLSGKKARRTCPRCKGAETCPACRGTGWLGVG
jgi:hypothetical protein